MPISLIKKNQLDPNISDLVGEYGSGFFLPLAASGQITGFIGEVVKTLTGVLTVEGLQGILDLSGASGINVSIDGDKNSIIIAYTGTPVSPNVFYITGDQTVSGNKNFVGGLSINGNAVLTGTDLSNYVLKSDTGTFIRNNDTGVFYGANNPSGFITGVDFTPYVLNVNTGSFITSHQTGSFYSASNPSGFTTFDQLATGLSGVIQVAIGYSMLSANAAVSGLSESLTGVYATYAQLTGLSGYQANIDSLLATYAQLTGYSGFEATVNSAFATYAQLTGLSGYSSTVIDLSLTGSTLVGYIESLSGMLVNDFYPNSNPSGYVTGVDLSNYVLNPNSGSFITTEQTGAFYGTDNPSGFITGIDLSAYALTPSGSAFITTEQTGAFYGTDNPSGFITGLDTSNFYTNDNPSGFITGVNLSAYALNANTGSFVTTAQTGAFYDVNNPSGYITGVSDFTYLSGDLTGNLLSPTLAKIQGNPVSSQPPANGQTLQWNGTAWVPGAIPAGGNGGGGRVYYFNFNNTSGIAPTGGLPTTGDFPISLLGRTYNIGSGSAQSANLDPHDTYQLICGFVSASEDAGITNIPAGLWDFNIWASVDSQNATQSSIKTVLHIYNPSNSTYRKVAESDDVFLYDMEAPTQYITNITVPQTGILATERLYIEVYGKKYTSSSRRITLYFDSYRPSHVHTTIPSVLGNGVVKVVNGVFQSPATGIFDSDIDNNANISQGKIANLTTDLANLYPRSNPSGYVSTGQTGAFYSTSNPSGFIPTVNGTGVSNGGNVITGNYSISSIVNLSQSQYSQITPISGVLYIIT